MRRCGTGSGSDLVYPRGTSSEAPSRYRSLYRNGGAAGVSASGDNRRVIVSVG
jgi:hypothetical protein